MKLFVFIVVRIENDAQEFLCNYEFTISACMSFDIAELGTITEVVDYHKNMIFNCKTPFYDIFDDVLTNLTWVEIELASDQVFSFLLYVFWVSIPPVNNCMNLI